MRNEITVHKRLERREDRVLEILQSADFDLASKTSEGIVFPSCEVFAVYGSYGSRTGRLRLKPINEQPSYVFPEGFTFHYGLDNTITLISSTTTLFTYEDTSNDNFYIKLHIRGPSPGNRTTHVQIDIPLGSMPVPKPDRSQQSELEQLGLSTRSFRGLHHAGIRTISQLTKLHETGADYSKYLHYFGENSYREVGEKLRAFNASRS